MLLHITPRLLKPPGIPADCTLIDLALPELGLTLAGGRDVVARQPYPNRDYLVACRNVGRKAIAGLFIETPDRVETFAVIARWAIEGQMVGTHYVRYVLVDQDHDAATDNMVLWGRLSGNLGEWHDRWPQHTRHWTPAEAQPRMGVLRADLNGRQGDVRDQVSPAGVIKERLETFLMPTIERGRLMVRTPLTERFPTLEHAFRSETSKPASADISDTRDDDCDREGMRIAP